MAWSPGISRSEVSARFVWHDLVFCRGSQHFLTYFFIFCKKNGMEHRDFQIGGFSEICLTRSLFLSRLTTLFDLFFLFFVKNGMEHWDSRSEVSTEFTWIIWISIEAQLYHNFPIPKPLIWNSSGKWQRITVVFKKRTKTWNLCSIYQRWKSKYLSKLQIHW